MTPAILTLDLDTTTQKIITSTFESHYHVSHFDKVKEAEDMMSLLSHTVRAIVLNFDSSQYSAMDMMKTLRDMSVLPEIIITSTDADLEQAKNLMTSGAFDFVTLPLEKEHLIDRLNQALQPINFIEKIRLHARNSFFSKKDTINREKFLKFLQDKRRSQGKDLSTEDLFAIIPPRRRSNKLLLGQITSLVGEEAMANLKSFPPSKILVIEDEPDFNSLISDSLSMDFEVFKALNGETAKTIVQENSDLAFALMDMGLPDIFGADLLKELKAINPSLEIIVLTAYKDLSLVIQTIRSGAFDYVNKPFRVMELLDLCDDALERHYINRILDDLMPALVDDVFDERLKVRLLNELVKIRNNENKPLKMADVYCLFSDLSDRRIPDDTAIPQSLTDDGMLLFVEGAYKELV